MYFLNRFQAQVSLTSSKVSSNHLPAIPIPPSTSSIPSSVIFSSSFVSFQIQFFIKLICCSFGMLLYDHYKSYSQPRDYSLSALFTSYFLLEDFNIHFYSSRPFSFFSRKGSLSYSSTKIFPHTEYPCSFLFFRVEYH